MISLQVWPACPLPAECQAFEAFLEQVPSKFRRGQAKAGLASVWADGLGFLGSQHPPSLPREDRGRGTRAQTSSLSRLALFEVDKEGPSVGGCGVGAGGQFCQGQNPSQRRSKGLGRKSDVPSTSRVRSGPSEARLTWRRESRGTS